MLDLFWELCPYGFAGLLVGKPGAALERRYSPDRVDK